MPAVPSPRRSALPHRLAVLLVCATFVLLAAGALVTTEGAGMAFRDWPTSDGHSMLLYPWFSAAGDKFIEHGHRLLGALVGLITLALAAALWKCESRPAVVWLGAIAVALVIGQGLLGGLRVRADSVLVARIHGCTGPLFFATTVALAVVTSRLWHQPAGTLPRPTRAGIPLAALALTGLIFLQLVIGAHLRHVPATATPAGFQVAVFFHLLLAGLITTYAALLLWRVLGTEDPRLARPALGLGLGVLAQLVLGGATWVLKYSWPAFILRDSPLVAGWTN
nr:cytochrome oxidase assembly protein [Planctomycetales bacterium]